MRGSSRSARKANCGAVCAAGGGDPRRRRAARRRAARRGAGCRRAGRVDADRRADVDVVDGNVGVDPACPDTGADAPVVPVVAPTLAVAETPPALEPPTLALALSDPDPDAGAGSADADAAPTSPTLALTPISPTPTPTPAAIAAPLQATTTAAMATRR